MNTIKAACVGFSRLPSPLEKTHGIKNYYALVRIDDVFDLQGWRNTNVRDPKAKGRVPEKIKTSLLERDLFCLMNRGLIISAKEVRYDNQRDLLEIDLENTDLHGLVDGGHTYLQIEKYKTIPLEEKQADPQLIKVEIVTGLTREALVDIADGRNTSNQVKEQSLDELKGEFEDIKAAVRGKSYEDLIAYSEYEEINGQPKPISVVDIIKCIICLDRDTFNDEKQPTQIATRDNEALEFYVGNRSRLKPLLNILPDALVLWDTIKENYVEAYKGAGGHAGKIGERDEKFFKKLKRPKPLYFSGGTVTYSFPDGLRLPVFAAFRALIKRDRSGRCSWHADIAPSKFFAQEVGDKLTRVVCEHLKQTQDVTKTSRAESVWESCYDKVRITLSDIKEREEALV